MADKKTPGEAARETAKGQGGPSHDATTGKAGPQDSNRPQGTGHAQPADHPQHGELPPQHAAGSPVVPQVPTPANPVPARTPQPDDPSTHRTSEEAGRIVNHPEGTPNTPEAAKALALNHSEKVQQAQQASQGQQRPAPKPEAPAPAAGSPPAPASEIKPAQKAEAAKEEAKPKVEVPAALKMKAQKCGLSAEQASAWFQRYGPQVIEDASDLIAHGFSVEWVMHTLDNLGIAGPSILAIIAGVRRQQSKMGGSDPLMEGKVGGPAEGFIAHLLAEQLKQALPKFLDGTALTIADGFIDVLSNAIAAA